MLKFLQSFLLNPYLIYYIEIALTFGQRSAQGLTLVQSRKSIDFITVSLVTLEGEKTESVGIRKFTRFFLNVEAESSTLEGGTIDLVDETVTRFSEKCTNAVVETNKIPKEEISVIWTSPSEESGCVLMRCEIVCKFAEICFIRSNLELRVWNCCKNYLNLKWKETSGKNDAF